MARTLLVVGLGSMFRMAANVLTVTDLTSASYKLVSFAALIAGTTDGEVILVSTYGGGGSRRSEPPPSMRDSADGWRDRVESRLRQEGQLLERQRQWCADRGVRCRAELYEEGHWSEYVLQSAKRSQVDLILLGIQLSSGADQLSPIDIRRLAKDAPCPVSMVRLPALASF